VLVSFTTDTVTLLFFFREIFWANYLMPWQTNLPLEN